MKSVRKLILGVILVRSQKIIFMAAASIATVHGWAFADQLIAPSGVMFAIAPLNKYSQEGIVTMEITGSEMEVGTMPENPFAKVSAAAAKWAKERECLAIGTADPDLSTGRTWINVDQISCKNGSYRVRGFVAGKDGKAGILRGETLATFVLTDSWVLRE